MDMSAGSRSERPKNIVAMTARTRPRSRGRSSASSNRVTAVAASLAMTDDVPPLTAEYLLKCEQNARRFQATWDQGTSGVLAAHVMRLLRERRRLVDELEDARATIARRENRNESRAVG